MKKFLSVLLSLLMVVSCMTCLFTMPASAVEPISTEVVENLPENMLFAVEGTELTLKEGAKLEYKTFYQLDVTVTATEGDTKFYPTFFDKNDAAVSAMSLVGVRYSPSNTTTVETAYNYKGQGVTSADNAASNAVGTYVYTYIFSPATDAVAKIAFPNEVASANLFDLTETDWNNFVWQGNLVVRYMVKEGNNVFQRFYGYRAVGGAAVVNNNGAAVSAKIGGAYYNIPVKGGNTYKVNYNLRLAGNVTPVKYAPAIDLYETELFDHRDVYKAIRDEMGFLNSDEVTQTEKDNPNDYIFGYEAYKYVAGGLDNSQYIRLGYSWSTGALSQYYGINEQGTAATGQVLYSGSTNGYSTGTWTSNSQGYWPRRIPAANVITAKLLYTDAQGNEVKHTAGTQNSASSEAGRNYFNAANTASELRNYTGQWLNATYSLDAMGEQTVKQGYEMLAESNNPYLSKYVLNRVKGANNEYTWKFVAGLGNTRLAPAKDETNVALSIGYIYAGAVYDFDNFSLGVIDNVSERPAVKGKDSNGNLKDIHANDNSTFVSIDNIDVMKDEITLSFTYDATRDAYGEFLGWFKGDELVTDESTLKLQYSTYNPAEYIAVVEYENYMGNVGGFESYANQTNLMPQLETITFSDGSTRTQYSEAPTGDYWGQYEWNTSFKLPTGIDYDANVAEFITENGALTASVQTKGVFARKGIVTINNSATGNVAISAEPFKGENVGYMNQGTFIGVKAIEGLTAGKSYVLTFYTAYCRNDSQGLMSAAVCDTPLDFVCYNRGVGAAKNRDKNEILGYVYCQDRHPMVANNKAVWDKVTIYFTATDETEYFFMRTQNSQTLVDDFVCKEFNEVNFQTTTWDFEDGDIKADGFNHMGYFDMEAKSSFAIVNNNSNLEKLGDKSLNIVTADRNFNGVNVNFKYSNKNRYIISFDLKVNEYASYTAGAENKIEIFASKMNNMGYYQPTHSLDNAISANSTLTRYYEDGKSYEKVIAPNVGGQFIFTTQAGITSGNNLVYNESNGGAIWDEWQHFEIELDPSETAYNGPATFGIFPTGLGWDISIDNIDIATYSMDDINAANAATEGTKVFNIRAAGAGVEQGLRFKSTIDLDILDNFGAGSKVVEYGTLVMDANKLSNYKLTRAVAMDKAKSGVVYVGVAYDRANNVDVKYSLDEDTNVLTYTGVIVGIPTSKYATQWAVRGYVVIEDANGNQTVVYDDVYSISLISAATYIINESNDAEDIAAAQTIIDALN